MLTTVYSGCGFDREQRTYLFEISSLHDWTPPPRLHEAFKTVPFKFEVLQGFQDADVTEISDFISKESTQTKIALNAPQVLSSLYTWALHDRSATEIIAMKHLSSGSLAGLGLLYRSDSLIARYLPLATEHYGAISSIIIKHEEQSASVMEVFLAFAIMQLKLRGFSFAQFRVVSRDILRLLKDVF